ncbi:MAG: rhodanese-like domain-containing protein [Anaerolineae bacterium]
MSRRRRTKRKRRQASRRSSRNLINKWTIGGLALVLIGSAAILIANRSSPATPSPTTAVNQQNIPFPEVPRTPLADAKAKFDAGTALLVDTRSLEDYQQSHIPNAISLPLTDLSTQNPDLPHDAEIITYCT